MNERSLLGRGTRRLIAKPVVIYVVVLAAVVLGPLIILESKAAFGNGFIDLLTYPGMGGIIWNTVALAVGSLLIAVTLGTLLAWCVSRSPSSISKYLSLVPLLPLVVPGVANTTGWLFLLSPRAGYLNGLMRQIPGLENLIEGPIDIYSMTWIIILTGFSLTGFVYMYVRSSMQTMGTELEAAARVSGASNLRAFFTVTLPLIKPAIVYSSGIVLMLGVGQFTNPLLLGSPKHIDVLTTVLYRTSASFPVNYSLGAALSAPLVVISLLVMYAQRFAVGDQSRYTVVTGKSNYAGAQGSRWATVPVILFGIVALVLPIGALILVALSKFWSASPDFLNLTFDNVSNVLTNPRTIDALQTSIVTIIIAVLVVVPIGLIAALTMTGSIRASTFMKNAVDLLSTLPLAMPAAIMGFAVLYAYTSAPFFLYGTTAIIAIAYITLMIPHAVRPQLTSLISFGHEFSEASKVSGASRWRTFYAVELPLVRKGTAVACSLVIILLFHEFAASLMVASAQTQTVGTLLYSYYTGGIYPEVAVLALLMVVVTAIGMTFAALIGGRKVLEQ